MSERLSTLLTSAEARSVGAITFHRLCLRILRHEGHRIGLPSDFILCSEMDAKAMASDLFKRWGGDKRGLSDFMAQLPALKTHLALTLPKTTLSDTHLGVCRKYQDALRDNAMLDMDDLEIETVRLFQKHPDVGTRFGRRGRWIFVDEYQDTNANQVSILKALICGGQGEICAIGDADQAIYGFRGSDVRHFHRFESDILEYAVTLHSLQTSTDAETRILDHLKNLADRCEDNVALFLDTLSLERGIDHALLKGDRVALMSLHAAKGLEWEVVFITGCEDGLLPCSLFAHHNAAEERRIFYVGMTRARSRLILSHVDRRSIKGWIQSAGPSPFLDRIPPELCRPLDRGGWQRKPRTHRQLELF